MEVLDRVPPARGAERRIEYLDFIDIYAALNENERIAHRQRDAAEVAKMMHSRRFDRAVQVTAHARARMIQRGIDDALLRDLIETGEVRYKDERRFWIAKWYPQRSDNLVCAAAALESVLVIKTVMHHFSWEQKP
jgi:hypothetical protein